jgi:hypothetical protein
MEKVKQGAAYCDNLQAQEEEGKDKHTSYKKGHLKKAIRKMNLPSRNQ